MSEAGTLDRAFRTAHPCILTAWANQESLLQVCLGADINPADITYVEAHGTGTVAGDGQELSAINKWLDFY